jgi:hypothetical protein
MHQEDRIEKFTFGNATFKNIPKKSKKLLKNQKRFNPL